MSDLRISEDAYRKLCDWKRAYDALRREREQERESWDRLYVHFGRNAQFIIRTLDGHLCCVPQGSGLVSAAHLNPHTGKIELISQEREPARAHNLAPDAIHAMPMRRIRFYIQTDERIMGVPVFEEVRQ